MTKLLEVTTEDGIAALVNLDNVTKVVEGEDDELTTVYFTGGEELEVKERVKAIADKSR
jgi:hypothetical protein